ncbi:hypothetical protein ZWY2020_059466 [Hordeum vulgare]|nr:hypothetical protein ZWY2020_059466 [Hordeum vulgare]
MAEMPPPPPSAFFSLRLPPFLHSSPVGLPKTDDAAAVPLSSARAPSAQSSPRHARPPADHNRKGHYKWQEALIEEGVEVVDETYDDPSFLQNIYPNQADPLLDPIESPTSMVYNMAHREIARRPPNRFHGPLPQQSTFVASAGAAIPQPRVTTEMSTARLTKATTAIEIGQTSQSSARARRRARGAGAGGGRARGAGAGGGRARGAAACPTGSRGRGAFSSGTTTGRGRGAYWLLFGNDSSIPDLNALPEDMVPPTV